MTLQTSHSWAAGTLSREGIAGSPIFPAVRRSYAAAAASSDPTATVNALHQVRIVVGNQAPPTLLLDPYPRKAILFGYDFPGVLTEYIKG